MIETRLKKKQHNRWKRHKHVRHKVAGSSEKPRLAVFKSSKHIYCQLINDMDGRVGETLCAASTMTKEIRESIAKNKETAKKEKKKFTKTDSAALVGKLIAKLAKEKGISQVCFDRGGFKYHGRLKALADAARKEGLQF